jgi:AcrR family transcriptional regulator
MPVLARYSPVMSQDGHSGGSAGSTGRRSGTRRRVPDRAHGSGRRLRAPALNGGKPAQERELRAQGQRTVRRLLEAALAEFDEHGFQAVRVDDIARRAQISHGTFYLYFASKEDLFKVLVQGALHDMAIVADEFPVVTCSAAGRAALLSWVRSFCRTYEAHATVLWIITRTQADDADIFSPGLQLFFRLAEIMAERMTPAADRDDAVAAPLGGENAEGAINGHAELTGLLCLLMLEGSAPC